MRNLGTNTVFVILSNPLTNEEFLFFFLLYEILELTINNELKNSVILKVIGLFNFKN